MEIPPFTLSNPTHGQMPTNSCNERRTSSGPKDEPACVQTGYARDPAGRDALDAHTAGPRSVDSYEIRSSHPSGTARWIPYLFCSAPTVDGGAFPCTGASVQTGTAMPAATIAADRTTAVHRR